ncbi:MAG: diaminobutyrate acetyltransferase [Rhodospirillaceae bacterium]
MALNSSAIPSRTLDDTITFRRPTHHDGAAMWRLVRDSGALDENSAYAYLMMGEWFADTCVVAEDGPSSRLAGFVMGFVPPRQPDTLFVWQVGVDHQHRGRGLGLRLLTQLIAEAPPPVRFLEATVTPSNAASEALFGAAARAHDAAIEITDLFGSDAFPGTGHEPERRFRIGPILRHA